MTTKRIVVDGYVVLAPGFTGRAARPGWYVKGIALSDTPQAWRDAADRQHVLVDAPTLLRQNPGWKTLECKLTVTVDVPDADPVIHSL